MPSYIDWLRDLCLSLPHTTEDIQWGETLLFRIARKIYCVAPLEPESQARISVKCTPERFAELVEIEGIIPAPYMARNHWVAITDLKALRQAEIEEMVRTSYELVFQKLTRRQKADLSSEKPKKAARIRKAPLKRRRK